MLERSFGVKPIKHLLIPVLCASLLAPVVPATQVAAAPLPKPGITSADTVVLVGRRGRHRHRGRGAAGVIGAIIAGTLIAAAIREGRADKYDLRRCEEDFPDFDYETGTYINRYGDERICPYLR
jgi:hypothetical protein